MRPQISVSLSMKTALAPKATPLSMSVPLLTPPCTKTSHFGCIFAKHCAILCKIEIGEEADAKWFFSVIHIALAPDSAAWSASSKEAIPLTMTGKLAPNSYLSSQIIENLKLHLVAGCGESFRTRSGTLYLLVRSTFAMDGK